ncbi:polysaccharide biosynthesis tyrosine autokinase [Clostridium tagluense]|uniref:polysaccharide biosynthesis tyrosine autokinase n=1 Tax=Clostridium tagluense TaxID=360422 RepID=UPI001C0BE026|nr:polysaccharide biosynthesis tyrosine autokinase [Clostridium tagluense]MBU3126881.1 polysaccharide biosynthesis tyrosine autokinase [Clostridium tagluense]MCB2310555.1 polysaccharide biosynthesis tyrosine autokinase [Clostridium tagluense]MCB2315279.1 polysaccharide biosynthesis tyrosine autokinase [Clostridium tagluense]MCB2320130.1 polysaccharide biosynthesis tyrosine autokinase [Clostridium tagluense]MCB2325021.1 polysaccharide biosynthesis tyrosine autokinase [Clostridium tagluense]
MREENGIEFNDYLNIIRKKIVVILFIIICPTLIAGLLSFYVLKPVYEAKATVIVGKDSTDKITQSEVMMYQDLIKTYSEIGRSRVVAENAIKNLKSGIVVKEFMLDLSITPKIGTQIIEISYKSKNPEIAAEGANALSQAFIEESQNLLPSGIAKIMDKALIPELPITPKKKFNISIGFIIGLILSLGLVLLINYLNNTIKSEEDVQRYLNLPMVGIIPRQNKMVNLIVEKEPKSPVTEAFKSMRTNLLFSMENRGIKTLMVCSPGPKDGKTSVSTNIASTIAQTGKSILLIDCDLRKPCIHRHFNITNNARGLVDIVLQERKIEEISIGIDDKFDVLTAGKANYNPSELLSSQKMKDFIKDMEKKYDYVILDTPPIIAFADALTLATEKIGVILVIGSEESTIENCKKSKQLLLNINATIIGIVLNKVDKRSFIGYGYDYYSYGKEKSAKLRNKSGRKKRNNNEKPNPINI